MEAFRKILIGIFSALLLLVLTIFGIVRLDQSTQDLSQVISSDEKLTISSRPLAYEPMIIAPYKTVDVILSEEKSADFNFTSVGGSWTQVAPEGTHVEVEIRFKVDNKWTGWLEVEEEHNEIHDHEDIEEELYAMASSNPASAMQYKFLLYGDGTTTPIIKNAKFTAIKTGQKINLPQAPKPNYSSSAITSATTHLAISNNDPAGVLPRSSWGADESYRYLANNDSDAVLIEFSDDYLETFKDELKYSQVVEEDTDGNKYKWPLQYPEKVKKIIVHHSATTTNLDNSQQAIRDIYYYHAINKGWGDIGYNYIIDQNGTIYEGRYGGEGVIGAHAGPGNNGSIGIAVLGNYETNEVPSKVVAALGKLIYYKGAMHNIDPTGYSMFRGQNMPNIFGHKDIMSTACPGANLYLKLPIIRSIAANYKEQTKPKFVKEYDFIDHSAIYYIDIKPGETKEITLRLENIGTKDWDSNTFIVVDKNPAFEGVVTFPTKVEASLANLNESTVKSGEYGTFTFTLKGGTKSDTVYLNIAPFYNGSKKSKDYIVIPISSQQSNFKYKFVGADLPPSAMQGGETYTATIQLENTGNTIWRNSGENTVLLGADHQRDRISLFVTPPSSRIGYLVDEEVKPGEIGTFKINIKAPQTPGYYQEYFTPVVEGVTWMNDNGLHFTTTVFGDQYSAQVEKIQASSNWKRGSKYVTLIKVRNLGQEVWTKENLNMVIYKENDLKITEVQMLQDSVAPGEAGALSFVAEVDPNEDIARKSILVKPKVDGHYLLSRPITVYYNVVEADVYVPKTSNKSNNLNNSNDSETKESPKIIQKSEDENDIRVKLSFSGNPTITADGSFEIYNGNSLLETLSAGETATVSNSGSYYKITTPTGSYSKTSPIRFKPKDGAILEIQNYENRPAWNTALNDNQYRGVLEVQEDDDQLIVINELALESYLKGLGEVSNGEEYEKVKAIMVAARSYANYYIEKDQKFPGKPYHLDDDPNVCQKYIGYGFEKRAPNIARAVEATRGEVVTYSGQLIKTPYFNQSDGTFTKNAKDVWNWDAPYLVSVSDSFCDGDVFYGHGVGMSGCGAKGMAEQGYSYADILVHYYTGIEITDLY